MNHQIFNSLKEFVFHFFFSFVFHFSFFTRWAGGRGVAATFTFVPSCHSLSVHSLAHSSATPTDAMPAIFMLTMIGSSSLDVITITPARNAQVP